MSRVALASGRNTTPSSVTSDNDDVIKWKNFPRYRPFVRGIHRSPVNSPHKGQWRGALMFCLICVWINGWVNNREAGDLRRYRAHYDVIVMNKVVPMTRVSVTFHRRASVISMAADALQIIYRVTEQSIFERDLLPSGRCLFDNGLVFAQMKSYMLRFYQISWHFHVPTLSC